MINTTSSILATQLQDPEKRIVIIDVRPENEQKRNGQFPDTNTHTIVFDEKNPETWPTTFKTAITNTSPLFLIATDIVIACQRGRRSAICLQLLENDESIAEEIRNKFLNLEGGYEAWNLLRKSLPLAEYQHGASPSILNGVTDSPSLKAEPPPEVKPPRSCAP